MTSTEHANAPLRYFGRPFDGLSPLEKHVLEHAKARSPISSEFNQAIDTARSLGDRLADSIARIGGSWGFIIAFLSFLAAWVVLNTVLLTRGAFDPYPFIFLNLILSMIAALQAPIIMMSQNRAAERDRMDASQDYAVNLKAEIEILSLHEKFDDLRITKIERSLTLLAGIVTQLDRIERHLGVDKGLDKTA